MNRVHLGYFALFAALCAATACGPGEPFESVLRTQGSPTGELLPVQGLNETRAAVELPAGGGSSFCLPTDSGDEQLQLEIGVRASRGAPLAVLHFGDREARAPLTEAWSEIALDVTPGRPGCPRLRIEGRGAAHVTRAIWHKRGLRRPWVVIYVVDSLRYDRTPFAEGDESLAPAFAALARDGTLYTRSFSASSWTRPSVATILTGVGPSQHRVLDRQDRLPEWIPRLPREFAAAGWHTVAVTTNPNVLPAFGFLDGFDRFIDVGSTHWASERGYADLRDALAELTEQSADVPLFLYVHDNEPHAPYRPLERYRAMFDAAEDGSPAEAPRDDPSPEELASASKLQRAVIRSTSDRFGELMDALRAVGRYDAAVVVLTADHGEEFGDHGGVGHGVTLYQEQIHVPLVVKAPAAAALSGQIDALVSLEDLAATTLLLADAESDWRKSRPRLPLPGDDVDSSDPADSTAVSELDFAGRRAQALVRWPWKLLRDRDLPAQLFDLETDPGERSDLASARPDRVHELGAALEARIASARRGLELSCVAGAADATLSLELEIDGAGRTVPLSIGLEADRDELTDEDGVVRVHLHLRPAVAIEGLQLFDRVAVALASPDRDRLRIPIGGGAMLWLRSELTAIAIEGPDGQALPTDGSPIPLATIAAETPPADPAPREIAWCRLVYVHGEPAQAPAAEIDPELQKRLRALGYH